MLRIAEVLKKANIIHADIKPENFLLQRTWVQNTILKHFWASVIVEKFWVPSMHLVYKIYHNEKNSSEQNLIFKYCYSRRVLK
jgi:serine/threonine protein kinase